VTSANLLLSTDEVQALAGGYTRPGHQLAELHRQGFWRARRSAMTGQVVLERAHYEAVCAGADLQPTTGRGGSRPGPEARLLPA